MLPGNAGDTKQFTQAVAAQWRGSALALGATMQQASLTDLLDSIEAELRRLRYLIGEPSRLDGISSAFGYGQIPFEQWLGLVFLPNARSAVATNELPASSHVAGVAIRNLDGMDEADVLIGLLSAFDAKVNQLGSAKGVSRNA